MVLAVAAVTLVVVAVAVGEVTFDVAVTVFVFETFAAVRNDVELDGRALTGIDGRGSLSVYTLEKVSLDRATLLLITLLICNVEPIEGISVSRVSCSLDEISPSGGMLCIVTRPVEGNEERDEFITTNEVLGWLIEMKELADVAWRCFLPKAVDKIGEDFNTEGREAFCCGWL